VGGLIGINSYSAAGGGGAAGSSSRRLDTVSPAQLGELEIAVPHDPGNTLPSGFVAVPLGESARGPLTISVLVQRQPDAASGALVNLCETPEARVLLGVEIDAGGIVHRWLELHVQHLDGLDRTPDAYRRSVCNHSLDLHWSRATDAMGEAIGSRLIRVGWEREHPLPLWIDPGSLVPVHPTALGTTERLVLCTDDAMLAEVGLPAYSTSLARYLWAPSLGIESPFVPVTAQTPRQGPAVELEDASGVPEGLIPINRAAGLCRAIEFPPMSYPDLIDVIGGGAWSGPLHGRTPLEFADRPDDRMDTDRRGGELFLARQGKAGRLIEALHLKVRAWASAVSAAADHTRRSGRPLLNITDQSFRAYLPPAGLDMPSLWATRVALVRPGEAIELPVGSGSGRAFMAASPETAGIYRPELGTGPSEGVGTFRIRQVTEDRPGEVIVEGTLTTDQPICPADSDLIWLTLTAGDDRVDLSTRSVPDAALGSGQWRLRSEAQRLDESRAGALHASEGIAMPQVPFRVLPVLSSPCDLYALGVLGARTLLVDGETTLAKALDELVSLAREIGTSGQGDEPLWLRISAMVGEDPRWLESLGPHRLLGDRVEPEEALSAVPREIWFELLAVMIACLPGTGPDAAARDYGDARAGGLATIYEPIEDALDLLLQRTRSLIVVDWSSNREISGLLRRFRAGSVSARAGASGNV